MKLKAPEGYTEQQRIDYYDDPENVQYYQYGTRGGWKKYIGNPVLGGNYGTCFDVSVILENDSENSQVYKMWFSWRDYRSIGYTKSPDGIHWEKPLIVLKPDSESSWESDEVNRPTVIFKDGKYMMWYSGQLDPYVDKGISCIGFAESTDGIHWTRANNPVLVPEGGWEKHSVMCPHVLFDDADGKYKMWYAAGDNHEPDAIGYSESLDGINWTRHGSPIVMPDPNNLWEQHKVVAPCVVKDGGYFYMFYVGHLHEERAQVGIARSIDGITGWEKCPHNPIIAPDQGSWDSVAVYKPFAIHMKQGWMLWYNGAAYQKNIWVFEQIGLAMHDNGDLFI